MAEQLVLVDDRPADWRIDDQTRRTGLAGVAEARRALREGVQRGERRRKGDVPKRRSDAA
ncbi:MAG TPA: hypothetical protein VNB24_00765 [Acidimicrobiales bacterium]|nr:hypothetical protein [Acidimicrobiales bacterium]